MISIAIDGPSGAGKSTLARSLAQKLGYVYVDTGAMYRSIGLFALKSGVAPSDAAGVEGLLSACKLSLCYRDGVQRILLNNVDVSDEIRTEQVSMAASQVSAYPAVRAFLLETQRSLAREQSVVMDGRDIGTVVLPNAQVKIFLTADDEVRARRRYEELCAKGDSVTYEEVLADVRQRDYNDTHRTAAPLRQAEDAVLVDTSDCGLEESLARLLKVVQQKQNGNEG